MAVKSGAFSWRGA